MSNFKLTSNDKESGKVVYSKGILYDIVLNAMAEVEGTILGPFSRRKGVSVFVEKDGVYVDVSVSVKYGYSVPELAYRIQQAIKQSVENMTSFKVAEVDVHILDVSFEESTHIEEKEEQEEQEQEETEERN